jgi:PAS domain S-box-containing protein
MNYYDKSKMQPAAPAEKESRVTLPQPADYGVPVEFASWQFDPSTGSAAFCNGIYQILDVAPGAYPTAGEAFDAMLHPEDRDKHKALIANSMAAGRPAGLELRIVRPDGEVRHVFERAGPLYDDGGALVACRGVIVDVSSYKAAETALATSQARVSEIEGIARLGHWEWVIEPDELYWSDVIYEIFGLDPETTRPNSETFFAAVYPDDRERVAAATAAAVESGSTLDVEHRILRGDGEIRWVLESAQVFEASGSRPRRMVGTVQDITGRKRVELALRESEAQLAQAQQLAGLGSWYLDLESHHLAYSDQVYRVLGVDPERFTPSQVNMRSLVYPDDMKIFENGWDDRRDTEERLSVEHRIIRPDGEVRHVHQLSIPIFDDEGRMVGRRGTIHDITERKQAELALRERTAHLNRAQALGHIGSWWRNIDTQEMTWSDEMYRIFGMDKETTRPSVTIFQERLHPDDREAFTAYFDRLQNKAESAAIDVRIIRPSGELRYIQQRSEPMLDDSGVYIGRSGTTQDITERKEIENTLRERSAHLDRAQALGHIGSWWRNIDSEELTWTDEMYRIFGVDKASFEPSISTFRASLHPDDVEAHDVYVAGLQAEAKYVAKEFRIIRPNGEVRHIQQRSEPIFDESGTYIARSGTTQDITERMETENTLREAAAHLARAQALGHIGSASRRLGENQLTWTDEMYNIFGVDKNSFSPSMESFREKVHPDDVAIFDEYYSGMSTDPKLRTAELRIVRPDGELRHIMQRSEAAFDAAGNYIGRSSTTQDITEAKLAELEIRALNENLEKRVEERTRELKRSNDELQDFAYAASHDLQEPLRKIQAFSERLSHHCDDALDERGQRYLERIVASATRMRQLIDDLLNYSRVTTKAQPFADTDLSVLLGEVIEDLEVSIAEAGAEVTLGALPRLQVDASQMRQLFQNLISNALKFRREDVPLKVAVEGRADAEGGGAPVWRLTVSDNGIGFDPRFEAKIFGLFERLHGRGEYAGTGIGLATCKKIVERHGGGIRAHGVPGEGATFEITLPRSAEEIAA